MDAYLDESTTVLDEVVAIGYGHVKRSDLTGAVASLGRRDMEGRPVVSFDELLKGRIAGVQVTSADGSPGAGISIKIRGGTSINASSEPLYVIDGIPMISDPSGSSITSLGGGTPTNPMADLNPEDIESIDILKDASATAIYGSRGANGVVIVTTKSPEAGQIKVSYSGYAGVSMKPKEIPLLDSRELTTYLNEAKFRYNSSPNGNKIYSSDNWATYRIKADSLNAVNWNKVTNTNWQDEVFRIGYAHKHQISITGGNDKFKFIFSGDVNKVQGIVNNSDFLRASGKMTVVAQINKWLSFKSIDSYSYTLNNGLTQATGAQSTAGVFIKTLRYSPLKSLHSIDSDDEGEGAGDVVNDVSNPLTLVNSVTNEKHANRFSTNNVFTINLMPKLRLQSSFSAKIGNIKQNMYYPKNTGQGQNTGGSARIGSINQTNLMNDNILTYNDRFGADHNLTVMAGLSFERQRQSSFVANAQDFGYEGMGANNIGLGSTLIAPSSSVSEWSLMSVLARINYVFKDRYLLTASFRADGATRFAPGYKWGYFPSIAVSWRLSEEPFIKKLEVFDNLKFRVSYGISGNQEIGLYRSKQTYTPTKLAFGSGVQRGLIMNNVGNETLTWETTRQMDAGVDMSFLGNRLSVSFDYYYKITKDLLLDVPVLAGINTKMMQNIGMVRNIGYEVSLNAVILKSGNRRSNKLGWDFDLNFAHNENTVLSLGTANEFMRDLTFRSGREQVIVRVGESLGSWYGYRTNGIFQYKDPDLDKFTTVQGKVPAAGDWKYVDKNKDGRIDELDREVLGSAMPLFYGGFATTLRYKRFDLRVAFEYSYGSKIFNANRMEGEDSGSDYNKMRTVLNRWVGPDWETDSNNNVILDNNNDPIAIPGSGNPSNTQPRAGYEQSWALQDSFLEDGSYLRLSNITLSWYPNFRKKLGMRDLRFYVSAQNLFLWTNYSGPDPEVNIDPHGYGNIIAGYDYDAYPRTRMFTFGMSFTF
ncbi:SusC/RagA family TonB-linked outer membrane protein [Alistipes senegalensis]|uniref:SusC/RagA family TonB-linked outer membrane protein n=1 Tax=Alistipes senegalensis TaxID=1288121 RepID=UPI0018AC353F|nr:TonB-dependent receptor [Alistipes senegalensis]